MAQPQVYNRKKDFTVDFRDETDHSALNAEFDGAANSINDIRANLALIQADDGALRPQAVTKDALSDDLRAELMADIEQVNAATQQAAADAQAALATIQSDISRMENRSDTFVISSFRDVNLAWVSEVLADTGIIQYAARAEFPNVGSERALYVAKDEGAIYRWDASQTQFICVGRDWEQIRTILEVQGDSNG